MVRPENRHLVDVEREIFRVDLGVGAVLAQRQDGGIHLLEQRGVVLAGRDADLVLVADLAAGHLEAPVLPDPVVGRQEVRQDGVDPAGLQVEPGGGLLVVDLDPRDLAVIVFEKLRTDRRALGAQGLALDAAGRRLEAAAPFFATNWR